MTSPYKRVSSQSEDASVRQETASGKKVHDMTVARRGLVLLAAGIAALVLTACTSGTGSAAIPGPADRSESSGSEPGLSARAPYRPGVVYVSRSAHVFRGAETFCLRSPLSGTARYSVQAGRASFVLDIRGFRPKTGIGLDWINSPVRGYMVGAFTTDAAGGYTGTARMFRAGEVRAIAIKFERPDGTGLPGIGTPC